MRRSSRAAFEVSLTKVLFVVMSPMSCVVLTDTRWVVLAVLEEQLTKNAIPRPKDTDVFCQSFDSLWMLIEDFARTESKDSCPYSVDFGCTVLILEVRVLDIREPIFHTSNRR